MGCGVCLERVERPRLVRTQCCLPGRLAAKPWWVRVSNTARVQHIRDSAGTRCVGDEFAVAVFFLVLLTCLLAMWACSREVKRLRRSVLQLHRRPYCAAIDAFHDKMDRGLGAPERLHALQVHCISTANTLHIQRICMYAARPLHARTRRAAAMHTAHPCAAGDGLRFALRAWLVHRRRAAGGGARARRARRGGEPLPAGWVLALVLARRRDRCACACDAL